VRDGGGHPLRSAASVTGGTRMEIEFSDGRVGAVAEGDVATPKPKPKPRGEKPGGQGTLL